MRRSYEDTVIPSKYGELIQSSDEVPARGDVPSNEDAKRKDGEGVHVRRGEMLAVPIVASSLQVHGEL